jgi:hypothetical protein
VLPLHHPRTGLLYIILTTPTLVNPLSGTLTLGAVVHSSILAVLLVARRDFPQVADFDTDSFLAVAAGHNREPVVEADNTVGQDADSDTVVAPVVVVAGSCSG